MSAPGWLLRPVASYDVGGTAIRVAYDPQPERNVFDDPVVIHEVAHYGQDLCTGLGIDESLMSDERFIATAELLREWEGDLRLPLGAHVGPDFQGGPGDRALLARAFVREVLGTIDAAWLDRTQAFFSRHGPAVLSSVYSLDRPSPFYFESRGRVPTLVVRGEGDARLACALDGRYIQELHALCVQFLARWAQEKMTLDDAVSYFLAQRRIPYFVPVLAVSRVFNERYGKGIFNVQGATAICHLCAQIALNGHGVGAHVPELTVREIDAGAYRFRYRPTGELFVQVLGALLSGFVRDEDPLGDYFRLMAGALTKLGWPQFDVIMRTTLADLVESRIGHYESEWPQRARKLRDAERACHWLMDRAAARDTMAFIRAPVELVGDGVVTGPLVVGPDRFSLFGGEARHGSGVLTELTGHYIRTLITDKLWMSEELTCTELPGSPVRGSAVACEDPACRDAADPDGWTRSCRGELWIRSLQRYPGLERHIAAPAPSDARFITAERSDEDERA
jgi:hypothetical protein